MNLIFFLRPSNYLKRIEKAVFEAAVSAKMYGGYFSSVVDRDWRKQVVSAVHSRADKQETHFGGIECAQPWKITFLN